MVLKNKASMRVKLLTKEELKALINDMVSSSKLMREEMKNRKNLIR